MKAKIGWIRYDSDYKEWQFSPTEPERFGPGGWVQIVYFEVEEQP